MLTFAKAHAYGNDFLYVPAVEVSGVNLAQLAREICDRQTGVGADGLILYEQGASVVRMQLHNSDGGVAEVSGNGVRGLAALVLDDEVGERSEVTVRTAAGDKHLVRLSRAGRRQNFVSAMGQPRDLRRVELPVDDEVVHAVALDMGNPQCVVLGPLPDDQRFTRVGGRLEHHSLFPAGTNVEFVHVVAPGRLEIRIWERGCGPTQSSGTGSCASLVAAAAFGGAARDAEVVAPGGAQRVEWRDDGVYLTGWAEVVCRGTWLRPLPAREP
jgi:diaminopimelate epimerase